MLHLGSKAPRVVAVADIGSGSGGVAILSFREGQPVDVLAAERCTLPYEERSLDATIAGVTAKLAEAAQKAFATAKKSAGVKTVQKVYVVVRGPWTHSVAVRVTSQLGEDRRIDRSLIESLAKQAFSGNKQLDEANLMESAIIRVELNGYATAQPEGKTAHSVTIAVLLSDVDRKVRAGVASALGKALGTPDLTLHSGLRALISLLRESSALPKECVLIDMTSEATHIVAIRKGLPAEMATIPEGKRSVLKRISKDRMPEEVLGLLRRMDSDKGEPAANDALRAAIAEAEPELVRSFGEAFVRIAATRRLPNQLIVTAHEDILPWMSRLFARIDFAQFTVTLQPFVPRSIAPQNFRGLVHTPPDQKIDIGLLRAAALVNIEERA